MYMITRRNITNTVLEHNFGDLRLVNNNNDFTNVSAGRLEMYVNGIWGTICNLGFDFYDADVSCRQLGYLGVATFNIAPQLG